jgi:hypothetical protein
MTDLITRVGRLVVITASSEATSEIDQARKHRSRVRMMIHRERAVGRPAGRRLRASA